MSARPKPSALQIDHRFQKGLELFAHGEYFECHEVIEDLWLQTPKGDNYRDLYQGVIQAAAAIYQYDRKIISGAVGLAKSATAYLDRYKPQALGCDVNAMINKMQNLLELIDNK